MTGVKVKFIKKVIFFYLCVFPISVHANEKQVYDNAALVTDQLLSAIEEKVLLLEKQTGWDIILTTTEDTEGESAQTYGEDLFDQTGEKEDGVVCIIDMEHREIALVTAGEAIYYLTDQRIQTILDEAYEPVRMQDYGNTFLTMLSGIEKTYEQGIPADQYTYDEDTKKIIRRKYISKTELLIAIAASLIVGGATIAAIIGKYRLKWGGYRFSYQEHSRVDMLVKNDRFINQTTTHRRIPRNNSNSSSGSGGRSSVHTGKSGRSFGGGSKKF